MNVRGLHDFAVAALQVSMRSPMFFDSSLALSHTLLTMLGVEASVQFEAPVPQRVPLLVVSNHRSFLDAPLLITTLNHSVRFACHHYMSQVPGLREFVTALGCFPLDSPEQRHHTFFERATRLLQSQEIVGIFPEGAQSMIDVPEPDEFRCFQRGFAHLALRAPVENLTILPMAIVSSDESQGPVAPLQLFQWFDPSEPLFKQSGWHPAVVYHRVEVRVGTPIPITDALREQYRGKQGRRLVQDLTQTCSDSVSQLLHA
ncbi:MAG: lysophospholipid acyltransferase family protein [Cyanobacteria bacterium J06638_22]